MNNKFKLPKIDILFQSITLAKQLILPLLFVLINLVRIMPWWGTVLTVAGLLLFVVLMAFLAWRNFSYLFEQDRIIIYSGLFSKKEKTIYYSKIHSVNIKQNIVHRLTKLANLTIRFFTMKHIGLNILVEYGMIPEIVAQWIITFIQTRKNIVIIGKTNSGKTNLLKAMIAEMREEERIVTIESRREMQLKKEFPSRNIIEYEVNDELLHSAEQALKLALRQSPDRIIHAEIRDDDANIYVRACTRGHQGSMTTVHANHLEDVPEAIVDMCMLDKRGMDSHRLLKRVTNYVTQVGIQLAVINGRRMIKRIVYYRWEDNQVKLYDMLEYHAEKNDWVISQQQYDRFMSEK